MRHASPRSRTIAAAVRRLVPRLRARCPAAPEEVGEVRVTVAVRADGVVVEPSLDGSAIDTIGELRESQLGRCLLRKLRAWRLPPAASPPEGDVTLRFSFLLRPEA